MKKLAIILALCMVCWAGQAMAASSDTGYIWGEEGAQPKPSTSNDFLFGPPGQPSRIFVDPNTTPADVLEEVEKLKRKVDDMDKTLDRIEMTLSKIMLRMN